MHDADELTAERHHLHPPHAKPASNFHVYLSVGLSVVVTIGGFLTTWGRTEEWRSNINEKIEEADKRDDAIAVTVASHEATIRVIENQYQHIGKQLDRVETKLEVLGEREAARGNKP